LRQLDSVVIPCPDCGRLVEFFTDEPKRRCRCGRVLLREALPQCAEWCLAAAQCLGQAIDLRELQRRVEQVKNDPRARECLESIRERLEKKKAGEENAGAPGETEESPARRGVPPPQTHIETARRKAVESLSDQSETQLEWLGAEPADALWRLPVMDGALLVDIATGEARREDGEPARPTWQILALHYLDLRTRPIALPPQVTFASLPEAKVYAVVYENRVNRRLCATVGRDAASLKSAVAALRARPVDGGDVAFDVDVFPRVPIRLIWYAGDEELTPSCTLLLPANIESFLCTEDIVVLSESFVSRLCGKPF